MMLEPSANETSSENSSSTAGEVFLMSLVVPISSLLWVLIPCFLTYHIDSYTKSAAEAVFTNITLLLAFTIWCDNIPTLLWTLMGMVCTAAFIAQMLLGSSLVTKEENQQSYNKSGEKERSNILNTTISSTGQKMPFLTNYRGHMLLATAISILSVDFTVFPNRFAKTEMYGWSVMDAGVGCFVIVHGICSPYTKKINVQRQSLWKSFKSSFLLYVLGFIRLVVVKAVNYNEHVSEYGIHWNFFFTLASTKIFGSIILVSVYFLRSGLLAIVCAIIHQYLLSFCGVTEFVLSDQRKNFLQANKEGICSILGFVSIYLLGIEIGKILQKPRNALWEWLWVLVFLIVSGITCWTLMYVLHYNVQLISRKMANVAYCAWIIALTTLQLSIHLVQQIISVLFYQSITLKLEKKIASVKSSSELRMMQSCIQWEAINRNGLAYFLLSNLLTGLVNMSMDTGKVSPGISLFILASYVLILTTVVLVLQKIS